MGLLCLAVQVRLAVYRGSVMPRCADCGFLAVRDTDTREFSEVELGMLKEWEIPRSTLRPAFKRFEDVPVCFVLAARLTVGVVLEVIRTERKCSRFTPREHGFTPKDHREMELSRDLLRTQQEQRDHDRDWEARQEAATREWQEKQERERREREDTRDKINRYLGVAAIASGLVGVLLGSYLKSQPQPQPIVIQIPADPKPEPK